MNAQTEQFIYVRHVSLLGCIRIDLGTFDDMLKMMEAEYEKGLEGTEVHEPCEGVGEPAVFEKGYNSAWAMIWEKNGFMKSYEIKKVYIGSVITVKNYININ